MEVINTQTNVYLVPPVHGVLSLPSPSLSAIVQASEHGACPVIEGQKWAANLWVWNGPRYGISSVDPETGRTVDKVSEATDKAGKNIVPDPTFQVSGVVATL